MKWIAGLGLSLIAQAAAASTWDFRFCDSYKGTPAYNHCIVQVLKMTLGEKPFEPKGKDWSIFDLYDEPDGSFQPGEGRCLPDDPQPCR